MEIVPSKDYILLPMWPGDPLFSQNSKESPDVGFKPSGEEKKMDTEDPGNENEASGKDSEVPSTEEPREDQRVNQELDASINSTNNINTASDGNNTNNVNAVSSTVNAAVTEVNVVDPKTSIELPNDPNMPELEDIVYSDDDEDVGAEADMNNLDAFMPVSPILTTRIHKDHPVEQIIRDLNSAPQTRRMTKNLKEHEPKKVIQALKDPSWIEAIQDELLQFKLQKVWTLVDLPNGKRAIGYTQEEGIDYDEVFAPVSRIKAIWLFLAYASFKNFVVYQMDVKGAFLYDKIDEEVYVCQPSGFEDLDFPDRVYKVEKTLYGLHQAPKAWYETLSTYLLENRFQRGQIDKTLFIKRDQGDILIVQMSSMGELTFFLGLQVKQKEDGIFINQDKYVTKILKKFGFSDVKTANTPMETHKPLLKDADGEDVDEHMYRTMIGSLMYLTSSRPDITYLKGQPKLGLWYPKDSPFDLVTYTDNDYAGASLDRKSTTGGIRVNVGDSKLMLLGINLQLLEKVNAARHNLLLLVPKRKDTEISQSSGPTEPIADEAANKENVLTHSNELLLSGDFTFKVESQEVREERRVKNSQAQNTIQDDIDQDAEVTLVDETQGRYDDAQMFDTNVFNGEEVFVAEQSEKVVEEVVSTAEVSAAATITTEEITLAQALAELRSAKPKVVVQEPVQSTTTTAPSTIPKAKSITFRDPGESTTRTTLTPIPSNIKDKGKAKMIEPEKPLKMKEQIRLDEELAFKLQAEEEEQARLAREKAEKVKEANISWDNVQAMIEADRLLAERLQAREQEELTDEEKARLFVELLEKRKKHFVALRAQEKRNKSPTKAQKKKIQKLFDKAMTRVNMFVDKDTELVKKSLKKAEAEMSQESSSKRAGEELE
ncbi:putative ribonuclease H-like domain-containing protein [Tanacetum coccineum]